VRAGEQYIQVAPFWMTAQEAPPPSTVKLTLKAGQITEDVKLTAAPLNRR
jgi:hypothetical protein